MTLRTVLNPHTLRLALSSSSAAPRWDELIWARDTPWRSGYCSQFVHFRHSCESMGWRVTFFCAAVSDAMKASAASLVETPVCCREKSPGATFPSVVTPRNGSAKAFPLWRRCSSTLRDRLHHPAGGAWSRWSDPISSVGHPASRIAGVRRAQPARTRQVGGRSPHSITTAASGPARVICAVAARRFAPSCLWPCALPHALTR